MLAAVQHVHHRDGQDVRGLAAEVAPEREPLLGRRGVRGRQRDGENRVGAEPRLVGRAVQRDQRAVERRLVEGVLPGDAAAISPLTFSTARRTPLPSQSAPPSRSSVASNSPVEAPDGTAARPPRRSDAELDLDGRIAPGNRGSAGHGRARSGSRLMSAPLGVEAERSSGSSSSRRRPQRPARRPRPPRNLAAPRSASSGRTSACAPP